MIPAETPPADPDKPAGGDEWTLKAWTHGRQGADGDRAGDLIEHEEFIIDWDIRKQGDYYQAHPWDTPPREIDALDNFTDTWNGHPLYKKPDDKGISN